VRVKLHVDVELARSFWNWCPDLTNLSEATTTVSCRVAGILCGRSPAAIRAAIRLGTLPADGKYHRRIKLSDLARWSDRDPFGPEDFMRVRRAVHWEAE
jgi:hypothetical protein